MTRRDEPEDVLSSIRRLVAGEDGTGEDQPGPRPPILLLGPAVRVTEPEDAFQMIHRRASERRAERGPGRAAEAAPAGGDAALRALVVEVVREELAGELGQRITRNLRQLVLRELRAANGPGGASRTTGSGPEA